MRGYKVFDKNLRCRDFQFVVGETYTHEGKVELCRSGFHFCLKAADCFNYYDFDSQNRVCEVEADLVSNECESDSKRCCCKITLIRELSWHEVLELVNTGLNNTGHSNSGDYNSGHRNSGDYNSGHYNSGYYNSGNYNSGNYNSGLFNTDEPKLRIFGKNAEVTMSELIEQNRIPYVSLVYKRVINGKIVEYSYKEAWQNWWNNNDESTPYEKEKILTLPNFDAKIFEEITGIVV